MPYVTSVERIGIRKGIAQGRAEGLEQGLEKGLEQGLERERQLLLRLIHKRFGPEVARQSEALLAGIADAQRLEDLVEALLDSADGTAWMQVLAASSG